MVTIRRVKRVENGLRQIGDGDGNERKIKIDDLLLEKKQKPLLCIALIDQSGVGKNEIKRTLSSMTYGV